MSRIIQALVASLLGLACQPPCVPGEVEVFGQRYFLALGGTPITKVMARRGSCTDDQLTLQKGTVGLRAEPSPEQSTSIAGVQARVYIPDAPMGESEVSILVAGVNRFFRIHRASGVAPTGFQKLTFGACGPIMESGARMFCNAQTEAKGVVEFAGDTVVQRWPGRLFSSAQTLFHAQGSRLAVFTGPEEGKSLEFEGDVLAVSGTPELLFVSTATRLHAVDVASGARLAETLLPTNTRPTRIVAKGATVAVRTQKVDAAATTLLRYTYSAGQLQALAEPRRATISSGLSSDGLFWQCGDGFLHFIDAAGDGTESTFGPIPGNCHGSWDNPTLWAGYDRDVAFCPLGDPREGNFIGIYGLAFAEFICDRQRVTLVDRLNDFTLFVDFSNLPR